MIIFTHHTGEPHGILGAQVAATFLERKLSIPSIVVGIEREFSKGNLLRFIDEYYDGKWSPTSKPMPSNRHSCGATKVVAFSHLCGRKDLIELAQELKQEGFIPFLGGPQVRQDYDGEPDIDAYPHRFRGLRSIFDLAFHGPVDGLRPEHLGLRGSVIEHPWTRDIYLEVNWLNIYTFSDSLKKVDVQLGQVLNAVGCPYAKQAQAVTLPPPTNLREKGVPALEVQSEGCIFCDVAKDKGYHGTVAFEQVIGQVAGLPEVDGRKIPFELIDEYPVRSLGKLLLGTKNHGIKLSQINLVCRADDINAQPSELDDILSLAQRLDVRIMFASIGFESFSDRLLQFFCKGITVEDNLKCVETLRKLKNRFRSHLLYRRDEGANHGFIRPTPWDDSETLMEIDRNIFLQGLFEDILPEHSTPLIIHHASHLGNWIRQIESRTGITFSRDGTWIEWWNSSLK